jgi:hypothetical protein
MIMNKRRSIPRMTSQKTGRTARCRH